MGLFKGLGGPGMRHEWHYSLNTCGAFALTEAETANETETDTMVTVPKTSVSRCSMDISTQF